MRDEDDRLPHLLLNAAELAVHFRARDRIERAERLVHQQDRRVARQRARHADALTLAARQLIGPAPGVLGRRQSDQLEQLFDARRDAPVVPTEEPRHHRDVLRDAHVRKQSDFLHHVADPPPELERIPR